MKLQVIRRKKRIKIKVEINKMTHNKEKIPTSNIVSFEKINRIVNPELN